MIAVECPFTATSQIVNKIALLNIRQKTITKNGNKNLRNASTHIWKINRDKVKFSKSKL